MTWVDLNPKGFRHLWKYNRDVLLVKIWVVTSLDPWPWGIPVLNRAIYSNNSLLAVNWILWMPNYFSGHLKYPYRKFNNNERAGSSPLKMMWIMQMFTISSRQCHSVRECNTIWLGLVCTVTVFVPKVELGEQRVKWCSSGFFFFFFLLLYAVIQLLSSNF